MEDRKSPFSILYLQSSTFSGELFQQPASVLPRSSHIIPASFRPKISLSPLFQEGLESPRRKIPPLERGTMGDLSSTSAAVIAWTF